MILKEVLTKNQKNKKSQSMPFWANPKIKPFFIVKFFHFFHPYALRVPIFYSQKSKKQEKNFLNWVT